MNNNLKMYIVGLLFISSSILIIIFAPAITLAGGGGYSQGYYQGYYQSYYQGTYTTTFSGAATVTEDAKVTGSITKGSGTFAIDDPVDPKNKILFHSFVESPDVKNIYDGIVVLDATGSGVVTLPAYFEALNKDFRYQIKPILQAMPNLYIKKEVYKNAFTIAGGVPEGKVSWQVTGIRHDPYILANPIIPEVGKGPGQLVNKGQYLFSGYASSTDSNKTTKNKDNKIENAAASEKVSLFTLMIRWVTSIF